MRFVEFTWLVISLASYGGAEQSRLREKTATLNLILSGNRGAQASAQAECISRAPLHSQDLQVPRLDTLHVFLRIRSSQRQVSAHQRQASVELLRVPRTKPQSLGGRVASFFICYILPRKAGKLAIRAWRLEILSRCAFAVHAMYPFRIVLAKLALCLLVSISPRASGALPVQEKSSLPRNEAQAALESAQSLAKQERWPEAI